MRTTINLDEETFQIIRNLAKSNRQSISKTVAFLIRKGISGGSHESVDPGIQTDPLTGFPILRSDDSITDEDVRSLEDDA